MSASPRHNATLSAVQLQVVERLAAGASISAAAQAAGVHRSTVHNWLKDEAFAAEFDTSRQHYAESLRDQLQELSALALHTLRQLVENPDTPPSVRLRAALAVLNRPAFPGKTWTLPVSIESSEQQRYRSHMDAIEAEIGYLRASETLDRRERAHENAPRNSPCPCGSGKKYKRCCGIHAAPVLTTPRAA